MAGNRTKGSVRQKGSTFSMARKKRTENNFRNQYGQPIKRATPSRPSPQKGQLGKKSETRKIENQKTRKPEETRKSENQKKPDQALKKASPIKRGDPKGVVSHEGKFEPNGITGKVRNQVKPDPEKIKAVPSIPKKRRRQKTRNQETKKPRNEKKADQAPKKASPNKSLLSLIFIFIFFSSRVILGLLKPRTKLSSLPFSS